MQTHEERGVDLTANELARYARHLSLPEIGIVGQKKLKESSVLVVGTGGLGSPLLLYLAAAGVGHIGIVDFDCVEDSNLQRQIIHGSSVIGQNKTESARRSILEINQFCNIQTFEEILTNQNALQIIKQYDLVCDCTDNFPTRYLINDACVILGKPNIYGSISKFQGQASVFNLNPGSPNLRDLIPNPPPRELIPSCSEAGVMGVLPGIIGIIQATEAIKIITGIGNTLSGRLLIFNALEMAFKELSLGGDPSQAKIKELIDYEIFCSDKFPRQAKEKNFKIDSISVSQLRDLLMNYKDKIILLDVRSKREFDQNSIPGSRLVTLKEIENGKAIEYIRQLIDKRKLYIHCKTGIRSKKALIILKKHGIEGKNIAGGIDAWDSKYNPS